MIYVNRENRHRGRSGRPRIQILAIENGRIVDRLQTTDPERDLERIAKFCGERHRPRSAVETVPDHLL